MPVHPSTLSVNASTCVGNADGEASATTRSPVAINSGGTSRLPAASAMGFTEAEGVAGYSALRRVPGTSRRTPADLHNGGMKLPACVL